MQDQQGWGQGPGWDTDGLEGPRFWGRGRWSEEEARPGPPCPYLTLSSRFLSAFAKASSSLRLAACTCKHLLADVASSWARFRTPSSRPSWISICHMVLLVDKKHFCRQRCWGPGCPSMKCPLQASGEDPGVAEPPGLAETRLSLAHSTVEPPKQVQLARRGPSPPGCPQAPPAPARRRGLLKHARGGATFKRGTLGCWEGTWVGGGG